MPPNWYEKAYFFLFLNRELKSSEKTTIFKYIFGYSKRKYSLEKAMFQ
jgi:hypothetical protein